MYEGVVYAVKERFEVPFVRRPDPADLVPPVVLPQLNDDLLTAVLQGRTKVNICNGVIRLKRFRALVTNDSETFLTFLAANAQILASICEQKVFSQSILRGGSTAGLPNSTPGPGSATTSNNRTLTPSQMINDGWTHINEVNVPQWKRPCMAVNAVAQITGMYLQSLERLAVETVKRVVFDFVQHCSGSGLKLAFGTSLEALKT